MNPKTVALACLALFGCHDDTEAPPLLPVGHEPDPNAGSSATSTATTGGGGGSDASTARADATVPITTDAGDAGVEGATEAGPLPSYCATNPWTGLEACGWPGPKNTGPDLSQCPGGKLTPMGSTTMPMPILELKDGAVVECADVSGMLHVTGKNVVIRNSKVRYDSGKRGTDANGTSVIGLDDGSSATVDHVEVDGMTGVHACIWHQGTSLTANAVDCHGVNDGIFSWADTGFSQTTGDAFTITNSFIHDLTTLTANGHIDGYQTEGAANGVIRHNTFMLTADANSCVAIWNSLKSSANISIENNLMQGGGAAVYVEDYDPSESAPQGGFSVTNVTVKNNVFSTHVSPCVGKWFVWYARPAQPYQGGPTDGWHRSGNFVLETGENVDNGNPHVGGQLCQ